MNITLITTACWVFTCTRNNRSYYPTCSVRSHTAGPVARSSTTSASCSWASTLATFSQEKGFFPSILKTINSPNKIGVGSLRKFFEKVDPKLFEKPTFKAFLDMTYNFDPNPKVREPQVTPEEERKEIDTFLTTALNSKPWQIFYEFLNMKRLKHAQNRDVFRNWIEQMWFEHYSRSGGKVLDSSGFEHVFIWEIKTAKKKKKKVNGLHNWIRFYQLERNTSEKFHYKGYIDYRKNILTALRYSWRNAEKPLGSMFVGTSPEYDMAIFTLCFLARPRKKNCNIDIDGCVVKVQTHVLNQTGRSYVTSAFPLMTAQPFVGKSSEGCTSRSR